MPNIPVTWRAEQTVNTVTAGTQSRPDIIQLANGNILVVWTSAEDSGAGSPASNDLIGRIYDPLGNAVSAEFLINTFTSANDENDVSLAPRPDGGFVAVYEDFNASTGATSLRLQTYNAAGVPVVSTTVAADSSSAAPNFSSVEVAVASATSILVVYRQTTSPSELVARTYDIATDSFGPALRLSFVADDPSIAVLGNGNYVVTYQVGVDQIAYAIVGPTGASVLASTTVTGTSGSPVDRDPTVATFPTALGGGFVIAWERDTATGAQINFRLYDAAGVQTGEGSFADLPSVFKAPVVEVLPDGTFIISYRNPTGASLNAHHFSNSGASLGDYEFAGAGSELAATTLADGRLAVAWQNGSADISLEILDTRDGPNNPGTYSPDQWQVGTIGNDNVFADGNSEIIHFWDGDDTLSEDFTIEGRQYYGDAGNDRLNVNSPIVSDRHDGGAGIDTIDWSGSGEAGASFNLSTLQATDSAGNIETMAGFENVIGTANNDTIVGNGTANVLSGLGGADFIAGFGGADTLDGGDGDDILLGGSGADIHDGGTGIDRASYEERGTAVSVNLATGVNTDGDTYSGIENLRGGGGNDNLTGDENANLIEGGSGNDVLSGGGGNDTLIGGVGNDTYSVDSAGDVINESAGQGDDRLATSVSYSLTAGAHLETMTTTSDSGTGAINLTGNELSQTIFGNFGANILGDGGGGGADRLFGYLGNDTYIVGSVLSQINEVADGGDDRVAASVSFVLTAGAHVETMTTTNDSGTGAINLTGNEFSQSIFGNFGTNVLSDGGGADRMFGYLGNDTYIVRSALSQINEVAGAGDDRVAASVSFVLTAGAHVETMTTTNDSGTAAINLTGNELSQSIFGNFGTNVLSDGGGADRMFGYLGNDVYIVRASGSEINEVAGAGDDRVAASVSFTLTAGAHVETMTTTNDTGTAAINLFGNELGQAIFGNFGANVLSGGGGADSMTGYGGADMFAFIAALGGGNIDAVTDFLVGVDKIGIDNAIFTGLDGGALNPNAFRTGASAQDADDRIVYDNTTGALFYDSDGVGGAAQIQFATLQGAPALAASDFVVI